MKNIKIFLIAALLGTVLAGCQKAEELKPEEKPEAPKGYTLVIQVGKGADTKALDYEGNTLDAYWAIDEKVDVYLVGGNRIGTLSVTDVDNDSNPKTATLSSNEIDGSDLIVGSKLWLLLPGNDAHNWTYEGQAGTVPNAAFDYATAKLKITEINGTVLSAVAIDDANADAVLASVSFTNAQSVYRFTFQANSSTIDVKSIRITSNEGKLVSSRTWGNSGWTSNYGTIMATPTVTADHKYCLSIRNENLGDSNNYAFTVVRSSDNAVLEGTKVINKALENGKFYNTTISNLAQKTMASSATEITASANVL